MASIDLSLTDEQRALRAGVLEICKRYPGEYWRDLDTRREYPEKFVTELTEAGYLGGADPQEYGGAGLGIRDGGLILETINYSGGNAGRLPRPDVHHGDGAAARLRGAEARVSAEDRDGRPAAAGVRRDRAELGLGHDQAPDHGDPQGRPLRRQRPEDLHLARAPVRPDAPAGAHDAGGPGEAPDRRAVGLPDRHPRPEGLRGPAAPDDDEPLDERPLLRQRRDPGHEPDRRGGQGVLTTSWTG